MLVFKDEFVLNAHSAFGKIHFLKKSWKNCSVVSAVNFYITSILS